MDVGLLVVREGAAVLELLAREDQPLLVRRDALLVLDLLLDVLDGVRRLDVQRDGLPRERLHEDLHAATEAEHEVQCRLLLDAEREARGVRESERERRGREARGRAQGSERDYKAAGE